MPRVARYMETAYIIPYSLNKISELSRPEIRDSPRTWDMLRHWTTLDIKSLVGNKINAPANVIYMTSEEHFDFGHFAFYLEPDVDEPHQYRVNFLKDDGELSSGSRTAIVKFTALEDPKVEVPDPRLLGIHAAFAKVLHLCGATEYWDGLKRQVDGDMMFAMSDVELDFATHLSSKLALLAH